MPEERILAEGILGIVSVALTVYFVDNPHTDEVIVEAPHGVACHMYRVPAPEREGFFYLYLEGDGSTTGGDTIQASSVSGGGSVYNEVRGDVSGLAIQAGNIQGGLHLGDSSRGGRKIVQAGHVEGGISGLDPERTVLVRVPPYRNIPRGNLSSDGRAVNWVNAGR